MDHLKLNGCTHSVGTGFSELALLPLRALSRSISDLSTSFGIMIEMLMFPKYSDGFEICVLMVK